MANEQRKRPDNQIEGEGSYSGTRQYNEATKKFVEEGKVDQAVKNAEPKNADEAQQMREAEQIGKRHAKGEDPALKGGAIPESSGES
jgi:hypothetical protein